MKHMLLAILLFLPKLAFSTEDFAVSGAGTVSCGKYLENQKQPILKAIQTTWAQGFISGINITESAIANKKMLSMPDSETIDLYLSNYCKEKPLKHPYDGAMSLYLELRAREGS